MPLICVNLAHEISFVAWKLTVQYVAPILLQVCAPHDHLIYYLLVIRISTYSVRKDSQAPSI